MRRIIASDNISPSLFAVSIITEYFVSPAFVSCGQEHRNIHFRHHNIQRTSARVKVKLINCFAATCFFNFATLALKNHLHQGAAVIVIVDNPNATVLCLVLSIAP